METLYEKTLRTLPERLTDEEMLAAKQQLGKYIAVTQSKYYMLMKPYPDGSFYNTVFKVEDNALDGIIEFIGNEVGTIQKAEDVGARFDFYINKQLYSLFDFDDGVVKV